MKQFFKMIGAIGGGIAMLIVAIVVAVITLVVALIAWLLIGDWAFIAFLFPLYILFVVGLVSRLRR